MAHRPGGDAVHDLHIWDVTSGMPALSAHVLVAPAGDCHAVRRDLEVLFEGQYRIDHTTLQVDRTHAGTVRRPAWMAARTAHNHTGFDTTRRHPAPGSRSPAHRPH